MSMILKVCSEVTLGRNGKEHSMSLRRIDEQGAPREAADWITLALPPEPKTLTFARPPETD
ncbi:MAG: hypothetical protein IPH73_13850 [Rhodocyclales bacterium]|nr:hypothetical protein [Rhodocyclales bacterium]